MIKRRGNTEMIQQFILDQVAAHPHDIARITAAQFQLSRQAVSKHLKVLVDEMKLTMTGRTRNKTYHLATLFEQTFTYALGCELAEDRVWREDILPVMGGLSRNVLEIWHYGFTEMFNNIIDHSMASRILIGLRKTAISTEMLIADNGIGIFKKIQSELNLIDERHALLELSKGKLTTAPEKHSGEGIFFTSRMFDDYDIVSGGVHFSHQFDQEEDWLFDIDPFKRGTVIIMRLKNQSSRTSKEIFDQYTSAEDYGFNKTVVPVQLARYGDELLVSRSQAKRLLSRVELFKTVVFDFTGVDAIGQAFADEIFRVFAKQNPAVELLVIHANEAVIQMISRAKSQS